MIQSFGGGGTHFGLLERIAYLRAGSCAGRKTTLHHPERMTRGSQGKSGIISSISRSIGQSSRDQAINPFSGTRMYWTVAEISFQAAPLLNACTVISRTEAGFPLMDRLATGFAPVNFTNAKAQAL